MRGELVTLIHGYKAIPRPEGKILHDELSLELISTSSRPRFPCFPANFGNLFGSKRTANSKLVPRWGSNPHAFRRQILIQAAKVNEHNPRRTSLGGRLQFSRARWYPNRAKLVERVSLSRGVESFTLDPGARDNTFWDCYISGCMHVIPRNGGYAPCDGGRHSGRSYQRRVGHARVRGRRPDQDQQAYRR